MKQKEFFRNPFIINFPTLDLHGMPIDYAVYKLNEFIIDALILKYETIVVIHGRGTGAIKKAVHKYITKDKRISSFKLDYFNTGATVIKINHKAP